MRKICFLICAAGAFAPSQVLFAQENAGPETIVVVADRRPEPIDRIGNSVTVLDEAAIAASQAVAVSDLLSQSPGVSVGRSGGIGQPTNVYLRGAESAQTLVLIDGVKLNDPSSPQAGFDFANLLTGEIDQIEILRGPHSVPWGSQAIGGVVNVITAKPTRPFEFDAAAEGGSFDTGYARAGLGGRDNALEWRLGGGYFSTGGIPDFDAALGGHRPDGARQGAIVARLSYDVAPDIRVDLRSYYTDGRNNFDGFDTPSGAFGDDLEFARTQQLVLYAGLEADGLSGRLHNRLDLQRMEVDRTNLDPGIVTGSPVTFDGIGRSDRVEYQGNLDIARDLHLIFGAEDEVSTIRAASPAFDPPFTPPTRGRDEIDSGYAEIESEILPALNVTGGWRHDSDQRFGSHDVGQVAAAWKLSEDTILRSSWGQGFSAPTLYELFSPYGNLALKPESANAFDAGIEQHFWNRRAMLHATYFERTTENLIEFLFCTSDAAPCGGRFGYYANVGRAFARGAEIEGDLKPAEFLEIGGNYTHVESQDVSPGSLTYGKLLPQRPADAATLTLTLHWPDALASQIVMHAAGSSFNDAANQQRVGGYTLFDIRTSYRLSATVELYARIENLFDRHYETIYEYGQPGRAGYAGLRIRM